MSARSTSIRLAGLSLFAALLGTSPAFAWGCKGHETVALIAEKHLTPEVRQFLETLLKENPIDPQLKRYCGPFPGSLLADSSTWPDDVRNTVKNGPWHYIDIPRGAPRGPLRNFCGESGCVSQAITEQLAILKDPQADPRKRADAARYVIHFVGDLHMPLHASTNNDEGGNCVPVRFFRRNPREHNHSYIPNLHAVWDTAILERDMEGSDPNEYAAFLDRSFSPQAESWMSAGIHVEEWVWESHDLAESVVYGNLVPTDPIEPPVPVHSCTDADNVGERMFNQHFSIGAIYQEAAAPVVEKQIAQAGVRLALILNETLKPAQNPN
jgi:S1/P1 Nuclease